MRLFVVILCFSILVSLAPPVPAPTADYPPLKGTYQMLIGVPHDGDTIKAWHLSEVSIRLYGINAPELATPAGPASRDNLAKLCPPGVYEVELMGREKYGRTLGLIKLPSGSDASAEQVKAGQAKPYDGHGPKP
jgi:endonuclease YncB( thermonuclease family)